MIRFETIKKRQQWLLAGIGGIVAIACLALAAFCLRGQPEHESTAFRNSVATGNSRLNPHEAWVYRFDAEAELNRRRMDTLEQTLEKILTLNKSSQVSTSSSAPAAVPSANRPSSSPAVTVSDNNDPVKSVRQDLQKEWEDSTPPEDDSPEDDSQSLPQDVLPPPPGQIPDMSGSWRSKGVKKISLTLRNARSDRLLKTVDNTIPAGAFAKAVLLGGVDASASIQASSDPRPALLRLTDSGTLPRRFASDLKGCHALAACYGDISSERVFMRLETLTCTERKTGEIIEVKVQGYVAGEDGRAGVRGSLVDRAGESMRNAMVGGFLGGIGEFLSQPHSAMTFMPMAGMAQTASTPMMSMGSMVKHGAGKGISNALDKYADFYIKRAEQVQPVIQVAAGREVDVVFTQGVSIEDSAWRQVMGRARDQDRYQQLQGIQDNPQQPLKDWTTGMESSRG
jgi:conjugal transfer pilus assembly protein TraB